MIQCHQQNSRITQVDNFVTGTQFLSLIFSRKTTKNRIEPKSQTKIAELVQKMIQKLYSKLIYEKMVSNQVWSVSAFVAWDSFIHFQCNWLNVNFNTHTITLSFQFELRKYMKTTWNRMKKESEEWEQSKEHCNGIVFCRPMTQYVWARKKRKERKKRKPSN